MVGDHLLRVDEHIHRHMLVGEQRLLVDVGGGAHPGDLARGAEHGIRHLAGHHVDLIAAGDRDQHVGILGPRLAQHVGMGGPARDGADVEAAAQFPQAHFVEIDQGDVQGFAGQMGGQGAAHLPRAEDENLHGCLSIRAR